MAITQMKAIKMIKKKIHHILQCCYGVFKGLLASCVTGHHFTFSTDCNSITQLHGFSAWSERSGVLL